MIGSSELNTSITGIIEGMTIIQINGAVGSSMENIRIIGTTSMTGIKVCNSSADFILKGIRTLNVGIGINIACSWKGLIASCRITDGTIGIKLEPNANQLVFLNCAVKVTGIIVQSITSSGVLFSNCELTQTGASCTQTPLIFTGQGTNTTFDTCYFEELSSTATFVSIYAGIDSYDGDIKHIAFKNCLLNGYLSKVVYCDGIGTNNIYDIIFENNAFYANQVFDFFNNAHSFNFKNNGFNELLAKPTNENFAINGDLVSWVGNIPNGGIGQRDSILTKGDGYLQATKSDGMSQCDIDAYFKPFYAKVVSLEFEIQSDTDTAGSIIFNYDGAYNLYLPISNVFKKYKRLIAITSDNYLVQNMIIISPNSFKIKNLKISNATNLNEVQFDKKYLTAPSIIFLLLILRN